MTLLSAFNFIRQWSAQVWTIECLVGVMYAGYLWRRTHQVSAKLTTMVEQKTKQATLLDDFAWLCLGVATWMLALGAIGLISMFEKFQPIPPGAFTSIAIVRGLSLLAVLMLTPVAITLFLRTAYRIYTR